MKIKKIITISFIALLVIALPLILIQVSKQQEIRQRASGLDDFVKFQTSITPNSISSPNQQVSFSIDLINAPLPKNIAGIDMQITYDPNSLAFYNFYPQALTNAKLAQSRQIGTLHYLWIDPSKVSDNSQTINLGSIVFLAKQEGLEKDIKPMISISNITVTALGEQNVLKGSLTDGSFEIVSKDIVAEISPTPIVTPTPTPEPNSCVQNNGICTPSYPCVPGYEPSSLSCESSDVCCIASSATPADTPIPTRIPTPTPGLMPFIYSIFPKEGPQGTIFTVTIRTPTYLPVGATLEVNFSLPANGAIYYGLQMDNQDSSYADGSYNFVQSFDSSRYKPQTAAVNFSYFDGKQEINHNSIDSFVVFSGGPSDACAPITKNGDSNKKIDIVVISNNYSQNELNDFKNKILPKHIDAIFSKDPFNLNKDKFNIWFVNEVNNKQCSLTNISTCTSHFSNVAYKFCPFFDSIIAIDKAKSRSVADIVGYDKVAYNLGDAPSVTIHEFGHSFGLLADEYNMTDDPDVGRQSSQTSKANCDVFACPKWCSGTSSLQEPECSSIYDEKICQKQKYNGISCHWSKKNKACDYPYESTEAHPDGIFSKALNYGQSCQTDTACYYGCGGVDGYRSSLSSIMNGVFFAHGIDNEFNAVSKKQIQKQIDAYVK